MGLTLFNPAISYAADYNEGEACSTSGAFHQSNDAGGMEFLICDGSNWQTSIYFRSSGGLIIDSISGQPAPTVTGSIANLTDLDDVDLGAGIGDGDCLAYSSAGGGWAASGSCGSGGGGGGSSIEYMLATDGAGTNDVATNDIIEMDTVVFSSGSNITLSANQITLKAGNLYRLIGEVRINGDTSPSAALDVQWYDVTNTTFIGTKGTTLSYGLATNWSGGTNGVAYVKPSVDTTYELRAAFSNNAGNDVFTQAWIEILGGGSGGSGGGASALADLTDVDTTGVSAGEVLMYSGGQWVPGTGGGGGGSTGAFRTSGGSIIGPGTITDLTEDYDPDSFWDETGSTDQFKPTEAGDYYFYITAYANDCYEDSTASIWIELNGTTQIGFGTGVAHSWGSVGMNDFLAAHAVVQMNGTTDYIEFGGDRDNCSTALSQIRAGGFKVGGSGGGGGASALADLTDVDTTGVSAGEVLMYSGGQWVAGTVGGGGASDFVFTCTNEQTDNDTIGDDPNCVAASAELQSGASGNTYALLQCRRNTDGYPTSGAFARWNGTTWQTYDEPGGWSTCEDGSAMIVDITAAAGGGASNLPDLGDVDLSGGIGDGHVLTYSSAGGNWSAVAAGGTPGGSDTQIQFNNASSFDGSANLTWNGGSNTLTVSNIDYTGYLTDISDRRFKENISPLEGSLEGLLALQAYSFTMKGDENGVVEYGLMAQDVQPIFPELVKTNEEGRMSLNYIGLIGPMVEAMKEQQATIESQQQTIDDLNRRLMAIENMYGTGTPAKSAPNGEQ